MNAASGAHAQPHAYDFLAVEDDDINSRCQVLEKIGEGMYGKVYKAQCKRTGDTLAVKKITFLYEDDGVPATALREISLLKECHHVNVIRLHDICSTRQHLFLIFEYLDMDLRVYIKRSGALQEAALRKACVQLLRGLEFCHGRRVLHRDIKPQNILIEVRPMRLVLADFGLARGFSLPLKVYTHEVVTLWYRAPEILLGQVRYGPPMDVWSIGCVLAEMSTAQPLFPGDSEIDTIFKIFRLLGTPNEKTWPGVKQLRDWKQTFPSWTDTRLVDVRRAAPGLGDDGQDLLRQCLRYNFIDRPSAMKALRHHMFNGMEPFPPI